MATIYPIICPECGKKFDVIKGVLMSEAELGPIPDDRIMETPFASPDCGHIMSTEDKDFKQQVKGQVFTRTQ